MRFIKGFFVILFSLGLVSYAEVLAHADTVTQRPHSYASAIKVSAPSVVSVYINTKTTTRKIMNQPHSTFRHQGPASLGSAVIMNHSGYLLTNYHVIRQARHILIITADGRRAVAKIVGFDKATDLAVLKIRLKNLHVARVGNSDRVHVGDVVLAIGNAFGLGQSVTQGIVSAMGRHAVGINAIERFIQSDVAMNPGNSGGPLINSRGEVIGINSSIYSRSGGYQGISFSIPINLSMTIMQEIIEKGRVDRGWLGVKIRSLLRHQTQHQTDGPVSGVLVVAVYPKSPANKVGIQPGDVVMSLDHQRIRSAHGFLSYIAQRRPGSTVKLTYYRDHQQQAVDIIVGRQP